MSSPQGCTHDPQTLLNRLGSRVLVTDFDGTMTAVDFFDVVLNHVPTDTMPDYWGQCVAGELTHVAALNGIFQHAPRNLATLSAWLPETRLDSRTPAAIAALKSHGWSVLVVSAGSLWYIEQILSTVIDEIEIIANPGGYADDSGLWMGWPAADMPWYHAHFGIDKAQILRWLMAAGKTVAFAGDGRPDLAAARVSGVQSLFAKSWLAEQLASEHIPFTSFEHWPGIAGAVGSRS